VTLPVTLVGFNAERQALVTDLSLRGAGLQTAAPIAVKELVSVSFSSPLRWNPLVLEARVVWVAEPASPSINGGLPRAGVVFQYTTPRLLYALYEMLCCVA
jgi:hypothetical protein